MRACTPATTTVSSVLRTIDSATRHLPGLHIIFAPHGCRGHAWIVDPDTMSVYIDGTATPERAAQYLTDALTALYRHLRRVHATPRRTLRLLEGGATTEPVQPLL